MVKSSHYFRMFLRFRRSSKLNVKYCNAGCKKRVITCFTAYPMNVTIPPIASYISIWFPTRVIAFEVVSPTTTVTGNVIPATSGYRGEGVVALLPPEAVQDCVVHPSSPPTSQPLLALSIRI